MKKIHLLTRKKAICVGVSIILLLAFLAINANSKYTICCAGDSLTYGSGVIKTRDTDSYPAQLNALLGTDYSVLNFGLRNATASFSGDLPYVESDEYKSSLKAAKKANLVILMLGANDSKTYNWDKDAYISGLKELVLSYQNLSNKPEVILMRPPFVYSLDGSDTAEYDIQPEVISNEIESCVKQVAEETGVKVIDLYAVTENQEDLYTDGIHFTKDGYSLIANTVYDYLKTNVLP